MDRRQFLKLGSAVAAAAGTLSPAMAAVDPRDPPARRIRSGSLAMTITPYNYPMIDGNEVYANMFEIVGESAYDNRRNLHPTIWVMEGDSLQITIINNDYRPHAFAVTGLNLSATPIAPRGGSATYSFSAPPPGSYLYHDPYNYPVNRILGLNGALIVLPSFETKTPGGSPIPYNLTQQTNEVRALFDALGHGKFPGNKWDPNPPAFEHHPRDLVWLTSEMDSALARRVADGAEVDGSVWKSSFTPDYFTISGASGFETARHADLPDDKFSYAGLIEPEGYEGQPAMIRCLNAGLCTHSLHIHGNDVYQLTKTNAAGAVIVENNIFALDVWAMPPMARKDMLLPFQRPLDAPVWPPVDEILSRERPMRYVMHCHCEMSNTAGGGNYPQGMVTHWEMLGTYADYLEYKKSKGIV
jgi:hypothetical protein